MASTIITAAHPGAGLGTAAHPGAGLAGGTAGGGVCRQRAPGYAAAGTAGWGGYD